MTKKQIDTYIRNMKKAGMVTKSSGWLFEGIYDKDMSVQYVGIKLDEDWYDIFSPTDNLLIKFIVDKTTARLEFYLANKAPFYRISAVNFKSTDKWEILLGEFKRKLRQDKNDVLKHCEKIDNIYKNLKGLLK